MEHETIDWTIPENVFRPKENGFEGRCFFRKANFKFTLNVPRRIEGGENGGLKSAILPPRPRSQSGERTFSAA